VWGVAKRKSAPPFVRVSLLFWLFVVWFGTADFRPEGFAAFEPLETSFNTSSLYLPRYATLARNISYVDVV
jgi:hypothetical protein